MAVTLAFCITGILHAQTSAYIDAGGGGSNSNTGQVWSSDQDYNGGWPFSTTNTISNTSSPALYQTQRINSAGDLVYNIPMTNGNYSVVLRFAELWFTGAGSRVFNVLVNGAQVRQGLDIVAAAGGRFKAYDLNVPATVSNGNLTITLQKVVDNPMINAIDVAQGLASSSSLSANTSGVQLFPGDDVQQKVAANPGGTTFYFNSGTYSNQSIVPKDGDVFNAASGAVLNGARNLSNSFTASNGNWVAYDADAPGVTSGICDDQHPACIYDEELYINDVQLLHVNSMSALGPGKWFFDYPNHQVVIADNPAGKNVEVSVTPAAFSGSASNVSISGIRIEKYANRAQFGAVGDQYPGPGWVISNVEVRLNHGPGVQLSSSSQLLDSFVHHNGSIGVGSAGSTGALVQHNQISFNNTSGFAHDFEAGGGKFSRTTDLTVRNNYVHDNAGNGFWTDTDNRNTLYEGNLIVSNQNSGIEHELSYSAVIRNNTLFNNGIIKFVWLWGAQFTVQNSQGVEAYGNTINVAAAYGNGIAIVNQNRGSGQYGDYVSQNNYLHDNDVTYQPGSNANSGMAADYNQDFFFHSANNRFDSNHYHLSNPGTSTSWQYSGNLSWTQYQSAGFEANGSADSSIKTTPTAAWN